MKTKFFNSIFLFFISIYAFAQTPSDALRFSQTFNGGTARFVSMGGAFGALGGDFGSISYNPAGLGVYRSSEFTLTPSFKSRTISSDYNGSNGKDSRNRLNFDNLGFVLSFKPNGDVQSGLINLNFAFGYNNTNDYNSYAYARGDNSTSSIMDYFAGQANGINSNNLFFPTNPNDIDPTIPWEAIMAWNTYLIDTVPGGNAQNYWASLNSGEGVLQRNKVSTSGSSGEYVMSLGMNLNNNLFIGASFNATNLSYTSNTTYSEDAFSSNVALDNGDKFNFSDYRQTFETSGTGYNLKIGVIYKPIEGLRIGAALHTPTYYKLQDTYSYSMYSDFINGTAESQTPNSHYDYHLETPFKTIASIAYTFKDLGLLSLDIEHVNYASMRFRDGGDGYDYSNENLGIASIDGIDGIKTIYKSVNNIRVGGEVRAGDLFLRGGYAFYPSPYKKGFLNENSNRSIISGGIGYRSGNLFIDAAYLYTIQKEKYVFYNLADVNPVSEKMTEGKFLVTLGFKF